MRPTIPGNTVVSTYDFNVDILCKSNDNKLWLPGMVENTSWTSKNYGFGYNQILEVKCYIANSPQVDHVTYNAFAWWHTYDDHVVYLAYLPQLINILLLLYNYTVLCSVLKAVSA